MFMEVEDPFVELRRRLRGADREATAGATTFGGRRLALAGGGVVLLAAAVVLVSAGRSPTAAPTDALAPPTTTAAPVASTTSTVTVTAPSQVWPGEPVEVSGTEVRVGGARWQVGAAGDLVAVGDWDCDGTPTPAVVRPSTGRLYLFDGWATDAADTIAVAGPPVPQGSTSLEAAGCGVAEVRTRDGAVHRVETTEPS